MNKPVGQAVQILILGVILLATASGGFYWMTTPESDADKPAQRGSLVIIVCLAGAVGGVANNFRRLQKLQVPEWDNMDPQTRWLMTVQIYQSPVIGALFAFVLYGVFASGILQGSLFPKFVEATQYKNLVEFARSVSPETNADAAKAVFWSFVAGFAEGFVPNFIDKVAKETAHAPISDHPVQE